MEEVYALAQTVTPCDGAPENVTLPAGHSAVWDMGVNTTGYIRLRTDAEKGAVVYAVYNERLPELPNRWLVDHDEKKDEEA